MRSASRPVSSGSLRERVPPFGYASRVHTHPPAPRSSRSSSQALSAAHTPAAPIPAPSATPRSLPSYGISGQAITKGVCCAPHAASLHHTTARPGVQHARSNRVRFDFGASSPSRKFKRAPAVVKLGQYSSACLCVVSIATFGKVCPRTEMRPSNTDGNVGL